VNLKTKCLKKGGPVEAMKASEIFIYTGPSVLLKKLSFTGTGFKPTFL
jgi:hypothetical protein